MAEGLLPFPKFEDQPIADSLRDVLNATGIGTLVLDGQLNIRLFTPAIRSVFRLRDSDIGRPLADMFPLTADPDLLAEAAGVIAGALSAECEVESQSALWFRRRILPCLTEDGRIDGVVLTFVDITQQRQINAALASAENRAQLATAAKSRFLAVASHDLRQPMQTMVILQGLLAGSVTGENAKDLVGRMAGTLGSMSRMLDVLLDINQIEAGVVEPNLHDFPIMQVLQRLFDEFSVTANSRSVDLRIVRSSVTVRSDAVLLEQMLRNLLSNALKYSPGGRVLIGCSKQGDQVLIRVLDTGIGIPKAEMVSIFDEYFQISPNAPGLGQGMGLGLNIVQRLGAILGHEVSARSELGKGTSFAIRLPLAAAPEHSVGPDPHGKRQNDLRHGHILVVEDDLQVGSLLQILLTGEGHRVTLVETAQGALSAISAGVRPDLVLTDYNLPGGMDGLALTLELRKNGPMPVIVLSGDIMPESLRRIASQDVMHLAKPVTVGRLTLAVASLLKPTALVPVPVPMTVTVQQNQTAAIHIVDDDDDFRIALRMMLEAEGHKVADHASCEAFLSHFDPAMQGCLLLDAYLPGMDGLSLLAQLRLMGARMPVIMITGQSDVAVAVAAMKAGAADFLEKPVSGAQIQTSILRALASDGAVIAPVPLTNLTPRQAEVLQGVMAGQASKIIAYELRISQRTVESHRAAIMARVGAKSVPELVRKVLGVA